MGILPERKYPDARIDVDFSNLRKLLGEHEAEKNNILYTGSGSFPAKIKVWGARAYNTITIDVSVKDKTIIRLDIKYIAVARKLANNILDICNKLRSTDGNRKEEKSSKNRAYG